MKKKIMFISLAFCASTLISCAQAKHEQKSKESKTSVVLFENTNEEVKTQINNLLSDYIKLKDALVADDAKMTAVNTKAFRKTLELIEMNKMTGAEHTYFMTMQPKLDYDAEHIQGAPNIDHMREHFATLSDNLFSLVKAFKANNGTVIYLDHCPMYDKGANWISTEESIRNPYFGKQMPTCGKVTETLN